MAKLAINACLLYEREPTNETYIFKKNLNLICKSP